MGSCWRARSFTTRSTTARRCCPAAASRSPATRNNAPRERFTERLIPGRWAEARPPNRVELQQTLIVAVPITSTSAKIRTGPPTDDADDLELPIWAGVLPLWQTAGTPVADLYLRDGIAVPDSIRRCRRAPGGDDELAVS